MTDADAVLEPSAGTPGHFGPGATVEVDPAEIGVVHTDYAPDHNGEPDPGEIVWTWVPFAENDGRGKDRPVLIVARELGGTVLAVQLSSKRHAGGKDWVDVGTGAWDSDTRESWVNLDRIMRIHDQGMRREACALERERFDRVVERLRERYHWD